MRDGLDLKRMMWLVVVALVGPIAMAFYNTGYQANLAIQAGAQPLDNWQTAAMRALDLPFGPDVVLRAWCTAGLYFLPVLLVTFAVGGLWEMLFAVVRGHEINEGFLVTGMLIPLTLPPTIPLWQVAVGTSFGVVIGKEIFGGTGMNILNPALTARAFLFFAYPAEISGDVWVAAGAARRTASAAPRRWRPRRRAECPASTASRLGRLHRASCRGRWARRRRWPAWPARCCSSSPASARGASCSASTLGTVVTACGLNAIGSTTNPFFEVPFWWHLVLGGWAFGMVYMATDPVTATHTDTGRWIYGALIGVLVVLIRVVNPAYPEGMMLAILFMNMFAPTIDHFVVRANIRRRRARAARVARTPTPSASRSRSACLRRAGLVDGRAAARAAAGQRRARPEAERADGGRRLRTARTLLA